MKIKNKPKLLLFISLCVFLTWVNYAYVSYASKDFIFDDSNTITKSKYALFLGTPKYLPNGSVNNYYKNRITSVAELYTKKKVSKIIISADSLNKYKENELALIKADLIQKGIHASDLILDKNGNSTWKSITNLKQSTNNNIIIISQKFHLERALYISARKKRNAIGFVAKGSMSNKLWLREVLARVKMQTDFIFN